MMSARAGIAARASASRARRNLESITGTLQAVSPLSVLSRGYAIAFSLRRGRKPILDATAMAIGERIEVQVKRGTMRCTVDAKTLGVESLWPVPAAETTEEKS